MDNEFVINQTIAFVKQRLGGDTTGHDWWHTRRVWLIAQKLADEEGADPVVTQLAALLHDIADWKFHAGDETKGVAIAQQWLGSLAVPEDVIDQVCQIIRDVSFKGAGVETGMATLEGRVVQDADRLDAIGAIGIARAFAYGGHKGREMHNPAMPPGYHESFEQYKASQGTTINHFYEKLLLLKHRMNTDSAKAMAEERHRYTEDFLKKFLQEWEAD